MKDLLSKEHYYYQIHILSMKSIAYALPPSIDTPLPNFCKKILIPPSIIFRKSQPPINKGGGGSHYESTSHRIYKSFSVIVSFASLFVFSFNVLI